MDISKASNFERFVFDLAGRRGVLIAELWREVEGSGSFDLSGTPLMRTLPGYGFFSGSSTHADRLATIRTVYRQYGQLIDTHTADGLKVALEYRETGVPMIVLETALPAKFEETIVEALGIKPPRPAGFQNIESLPKHFDVLPASVDQLKDYVAARTGL
jgi:threonine synthase